MENYFKNIENVEDAIEEIKELEKENIRLKTLLEEYEKTLSYNPKNIIERNAKFYKHSITKTEAIKSLKNIELETQKIVDQLTKKSENNEIEF